MIQWKFIRWIKVAVVATAANSCFAQIVLDKEKVLAAANANYLNWKGFRDFANDTTSMVLRVIQEKNNFIDSLIRAKEKKEGIIYTDDLIQEIKNNYFGLSALTVIGKGDRNYAGDPLLDKAAADLSPTKNHHSLVDLYARKAGKNEVAMLFFLQNGQKLNLTCANCDPQNTRPQDIAYTFEWYKANIPSIGQAQAKVVTIRSDVDSALVKINGKFKGYSGKAYGFWRGTSNTIIVEKAPLKPCSSPLNIAADDDLSPIAIECKIKN